jgi:competence protein ComEA
MQTKTLDALRLWWRDINFTSAQRKALAMVGITSIALSAFLIFKPHSAEVSAPNSVTVPSIVTPPMLVIDVQGEVKTPGVYDLPVNSRVTDALKIAGGATKFADLSFLNQARMLKDGEQIYVERRTFTGTSSTRKNTASYNGILNINRATLKELDKLPGIGPVIAARIIEFRKVNGAFQSVDDLRKVQGIGASTLEKFKSKIRV